MIFVYLGLGYLTQYELFYIYPFAHTFKDVIFFSYVVLHCVNVPHFPYPFFSQGAFRLCPGFGYDKQCSYEHSWAHVLVVLLSILWIYTQKTGSWEKLFPNFLRNHHTDIQSSWTSLHSHQHCRSVLFSPQPLPHKLSSVFLILAILTGVKWNIRVVLICISLMTKDVEQAIS